MTEGRPFLDPRNPNRQATAEPLDWVSWLAMDHGAVTIATDWGRWLMLRECHLPGDLDMHAMRQH